MGLQRQNGFISTFLRTLSVGVDLIDSLFWIAPTHRSLGSRTMYEGNCFIETPSSTGQTKVPSLNAGDLRLLDEQNRVGGKFYNCLQLGKCGICWFRCWSAPSQSPCLGWISFMTTDSGQKFPVKCSYFLQKIPYCSSRMRNGNVNG